MHKIKKAQKIHDIGCELLNEGNFEASKKELLRALKLLERARDEIEDDLEAMLVCVDLIESTNLFLNSPALVIDSPKAFIGHPRKKKHIKNSGKGRRSRPSEERPVERGRRRRSNEKSRSMEIQSGNTMLIGEKVIVKDLARDIKKFKMEGYAELYFRKQKPKLFHRKVPVSELLVYSSTPIKTSLLSLTGEPANISLETFSLILDYLEHGDLSVCLELIRYGIRTPEVRDELYCQVVKQTNQVPDISVLIRGWEVMCIFLSFFPPTRNLESYLESYISQAPNVIHIDLGIEKDKFEQLLIFSLKKLDKLKTQAYVKSRVPSLEEIAHSLRMAFRLSYFEMTYDEIMDRQTDLYPDLQIPFIIKILIDLIKDNGGLEKVGLFRIKSKTGAISALKIAIDNDDFSYTGTPHVPATVLKNYLKETPQSVIPKEFYYPMIHAKQDTVALLEIIEAFPEMNKLILQEILALLVELEANEENLASSATLGALLGPVIFRCDEQDPMTYAKLAKLENEVVVTLIHM